MVKYDGTKSHIAGYNFCYFCEERLEVVQDNQDEGWYFVGAKQIRLPQPKDAAGESVPETVVVHSECMKEIEINEK